MCQLDVDNVNSMFSVAYEYVSNGEWRAINNTLHGGIIIIMGIAEEKKLLPSSSLAEKLGCRPPSSYGLAGQLRKQVRESDLSLHN